MVKITIDDLAKIREKTEKTMNIREGAGRAKIIVHMGTCGIAAGAREVLSAVMNEVEQKNLKDVIVTTSGCAGLCSKEPMLTVEVAKETAPVKYIEISPSKVKKIIEEHIQNGHIVKEYALAIGSETTR